MNGYKRILKSQSVRFLILKCLSFIPDTLMLKLQYQIKLNRKLDLKHPKRFTEKLQWYKLYYRNPQMTKCADKYLVREYIKPFNLENTLCNLYGVYNDPNQIDFAKLPNKFVIKTTNGSGTNIICMDKLQLNVTDIKKDLSKWIKRDCYGLGREWAYKDIKPRIIIEELLENNNDSFDGINDYKFLCFNGQVEYVVFDVDRFTNHKRCIYDKNWNYIDVGTDCEKLDNIVEKPQMFEQMKNIANILSNEFPFVRVDLYCVNNKIYFGELTFYPWTGYVQFEPDEFDFILGEKFILPNIN